MDTAKVATTCPQCDKRLRVAAASVGKTVRCPGCQHRFVLTNVTFSESGKAPIGAERSIEAVETLMNAGGNVETSTDGQFPRQAGPPLTGKIGRFELYEVLGRGGFGIVYRARDPLLDRDVALKVPLFSAKDQKRAQRFINEARAAARLRHPNIVAFYEIGEADDKLFLAAEYIQGRTLADLIKESRPSIEQSVRWMLELAGALEYAHSQGIVHRDIKPHNIMIDRQRKPQVMDFGLAKRINQDSTVTIEGSLLGTPAYMPPEQARGELEKIGPHSDQYSLGVVLYELLAGAKPFEGSAAVVIARLVTDDPAPPSEHNPEITAELEAVCLKAMSRTISERYASLAEFSEALAAATGMSNSRDGHFESTGSSVSIERLRPASKAFPTSEPAGVSRILDHLPAGLRTRRTLGAVAGMGLFALLIALIFFLRPTTGTLTVDVNEPGAKVTVLSESGANEFSHEADGTSLRIPLEPGRHRLRIEKAGFELVARDVDVVVGRNEPIQARLERASSPPRRESAESGGGGDPTKGSPDKLAPSGIRTSGGERGPNLLKPIIDTTAWRFDVTQGAEASYRIVDKSTVFTVSKPTKTGWHAQLVWPGLQLRAGTEYALNMRARSPQSRHMFLKICIDRHDWHPVGLAESVTLAPQARDFEFRFRAEKLTEKQQLLIFELGHAAGELILEELSLSEVTGSGAADDASLAQSRATPTVNLFRPLTDATSWNFQVFQGAQGMASIVDGTIVLKVTRATDTPWHAQATRVGLKLEAGKHYLFRMKARSPESRDANVYIGINREDWHDVGLRKHVRLTADVRDYEFRFQATKVTHPEQRLAIDIGHATGEMVVEELSLTEVAAPSKTGSASSSPTGSPPPGAGDAPPDTTTAAVVAPPEPNRAIRDQTKVRARLPVGDDAVFGRIRKVTWRRNDEIEPVYVGTLSAKESVVGSVTNQLGNRNLGFPTGLAFHPDGRLALAYGSGASEGMALVYWSQRKTFAPEEVFPIAYAPYNSKDQWDKTTGREARESEGKFWFFAGDLAFDRKGSCYFTQGRCGPNGLFRVNPKTGAGSMAEGRRVTRLAVIPSDGGLQIAKFDPDHAYVNSDDMVTRYALEPPNAKEEWLRFATEQLQGLAPHTSVERAILLAPERVLLILRTPDASDSNRNQYRAAVLDLEAGALYGVGVAGKPNVNFSGPVEAAEDGTTVVRFDSTKQEILRYRIDFSPLERNGP